ncbi:hypothetical protein FOZ63_017106, partial [Perkinsus olseni]
EALAAAIFPPSALLSAQRSYAAPRGGNGHRVSGEDIFPRQHDTMWRSSTASFGRTSSCEAPENTRAQICAYRVKEGASSPGVVVALMKSFKAFKPEDVERVLFNGAKKSAVVQSLENTGMQIVHAGVPGCPASYRDVCEFVESAIKSSGLPRKDVVLTLIDTGIAPGHPELEGRLLKEREAETYTKRSNAWGTGHGTMMAGIIASNTNNMVGLAGIADKVKIRSIRIIMKPCGSGDVSITQSLFAFEEALGMKETSVVVYAYGFRFTPATALIFDYVLKKVTKKGILVLVSSSNSDRVDSREEVIVPCSLANATHAEEPLVLARRVAKLASLGVPGTEMMSLTPECDGDEWLYGMFRGSSGATAGAAGIVALMKSFKAFKPGDVERMLLNATEGRVKTGDGDEMVYGDLRPHLAVDQAIAEARLSPQRRL